MVNSLLGSCVSSFLIEDDLSMLVDDSLEYGLE